MKKKTKIFSILAACTVTAGMVAAAVSFTPTSVIKANEDFKIVLDNSNFVLTDEYGSGEITVKSEHGNDIVFAFENAKKSTLPNYSANLEANNGTIYNKTALTGISSVKVVYTSANNFNQLNVAFGLEAKPTDYTAVATGTVATADVGDAYFALNAGLAIKNIKSIEITYTCIYVEPPATPLSVITDIAGLFGDEPGVEGDLYYYILPVAYYDETLDAYEQFDKNMTTVLGQIVQYIDYLVLTSDIEHGTLTTNAECSIATLSTDDGLIDVEVLGLENSGLVVLQFVASYRPVCPDTLEGLIIAITQGFGWEGVYDEDYWDNSQGGFSTGLNLGAVQTGAVEELASGLQYVASYLPPYLVAATEITEDTVEFNDGTTGPCVYQLFIAEGTNFVVQLLAYAANGNLIVSIDAFAVSA